MFYSISWQDFLTTITVAIGGYYAITTLLLYSGEISHIFKQKEPKQTLSEDEKDQREPFEPNDLMGKVKYETEDNVPREKSVSSEELQVHSTEEDAEESISIVTVPTSNHSDTLLIGTVADLLQEIKALTDLLQQSSQEEVIYFFKMLLSRYSKLKGTHYEPAVNMFIDDTCREQCNFDWERNEVQSWWPEPESILNNNQ